MPPRRTNGFKSFNLETNDDANSDNYPGLICLLHQDDLTAGSKIWAPRVGAMSIQSSVAYNKDANGVYVASQSTLTPLGAMPVIETGKYHLNIIVGTPSTSIHIPNFDLGDSSVGDAYKSNGGVFFGASQYIAAVGFGVFDFGLPQCHASYTDFVNTSSAPYRVLAPMNSTIAMQTKDNTVNFDPVSAGRNANPASVVSIGGFDAVIDTQRVVLAAIFSLSNPLTKEFVQSLAIWMAANAGKICPSLGGLS